MSDSGNAAMFMKLWPRGVVVLQEVGGAVDVVVVKHALVQIEENFIMSSNLFSEVEGKTGPDVFIEACSPQALFPQPLPPFLDLADHLLPTPGLPLHAGEDPS